MTVPAHPQRVQYQGETAVHAARPILAGGHNTACLTWLDPTDDRFRWLPDTTTVTCPACERRLTKAATR